MHPQPLNHSTTGENAQPLNQNTMAQFAKQRQMGQTVKSSEPAYARAVLGVYEMTRVELLRDLFVWAYERSTQEYLAIKQDLAERDPLRLAWRNVIKQTIREVVMHPDQDAMALITAAVGSEIPQSVQADLRALITDELRWLHEGVLARYGLRPSEFTRWKAQRN
jgi:predicted metal-binding transcription factor (methanogenesis marker protein 9)